MKQGLDSNLRVTFNDLNLDDVEQIEFIFSQYIIGPKALKTARWDSNGNSNSAERIGKQDIAIKWEAEETYKFLPGQEFFMDVKIRLKGSKDNPETEILELTMERTLFEKII